MHRTSSKSVSLQNNDSLRRRWMDLPVVLCDSSAGARRLNRDPQSYVSSREAASIEMTPPRVPGMHLLRGRHLAQIDRYSRASLSVPDEIVQGASDYV